MLDEADLKWIATASTELNSMLQQVARYADLARQQKGGNVYIEELGERVEMASKKSQALFDRVTTSILADATNRQTLARREEPIRSFSVLSPPLLSTMSQFAGEYSSELQTGPVLPAPNEDPSEIHILNAEASGELILLVDDEMEISALASAMLCDEGYKVILAKEGFEALRIYRQLGSRIGLVILDFFLPVMDGDAVFDELRLLNPDVNVVLSSGFAEQSKIRAMLAQGLSGFIPKPYTREKLLDQVRSTLAAAQQHHLHSASAAG